METRDAQGPRPHLLKLFVPVLHHGAYQPFICDAEQALAKCSPWAQSSLPPAFRNKALREHSHAHSCTVSKSVYVLFMAAFSAQDRRVERDCMARKPRVFTTWPVTEKVF